MAINRIFAVVWALIAVGRTAALHLNLSAACSGSNVYFCTLADLGTSLHEPLVVVDSSAPQLRELIVRNSVVPWIPKEVFVRAANLHGFFMHDCDVNRVRADDFLSAKQLHRLLLQSNRLSELPEKVFAAAFALQELHLAANHIQLIHRTAFAALDQLRLLDLHQNAVHELPPRLFADLGSLEYLDLTSNRLERIDRGTFAANVKLQTLLLSDNKFAAFDSGALQNLPHLRLLDISYSAVEELRLQSVDTLLVQSSALKRCTIAQGVVKLRASNNLLEGLSIGDKLSVRELELHGNLLESLDDVVGMQNLQKLDVSKNKLSSLRTSHSPLFLPLPSLTHLNLASNQLLNLSAEHLLLLRKLTHLDLAFNRLSRLEQRAFEPLPALEKLYLEGNRLRRFDYEQLARSHPQLKELGVFSNDWDLQYLRAMLGFLKEGGINLPVRFALNDVAEPLSSSEHHLAKGASDRHHVFMAAQSSGDGGSRVGEVDGIHPYWTTRDILALTTLVFVMLILLLQFYRILQEENCFSACRSRLLGQEGHVGITGRNRPSRLAEEDSEV